MCVLLQKATHFLCKKLYNAILKHCFGCIIHKNTVFCNNFPKSMILSQKPRISPENHPFRILQAHYKNYKSYIPLKRNTLFVIIKVRHAQRL